MRKKTSSGGRSREDRKLSIRKNLKGTIERPRLCVFRSLKYTYAQIVSDDSGDILASLSTRGLAVEGKSSKSKEAAEVLGEKIAQVAKEKNVQKVVFDRNGYRYHGRVSAVADGARKGGLEF